MQALADWTSLPMNVRQQQPPAPVLGPVFSHTFWHSVWPREGRPHSHGFALDPSEWCVGPPPHVSHEGEVRRWTRFLAKLQNWPDGQEPSAPQRPIDLPQPKAAGTEVSASAASSSRWCAIVFRFVSVAIVAWHCQARRVSHVVSRSRFVSTLLYCHVLRESESES